MIDEKNLNAIVIDPGESGPVEKEIKSQKLKLKYVLNTHHHTDHDGMMMISSRCNYEIVKISL